MSKLELYNIDCMELMAKYPDKYFELAIATVSIINYI